MKWRGIEPKELIVVGIAMAFLMSLIIFSLVGIISQALSSLM